MWLALGGGGDMQTDRHRQTDVWATCRESRWGHRSEAQVLVSREDGALLTQDHARWGTQAPPRVSVEPSQLHPGGGGEGSPGAEAGVRGWRGEERKGEGAMTKGREGERRGKGQRRRWWWGDHGKGCPTPPSLGLSKEAPWPLPGLKGSPPGFANTLHGHLLHQPTRPWGGCWG